MAPAMPLLLLGNSYTFYNDLDLVLEALLVEAGEADAATTRLADGGLAFPDHVERASTVPEWQDALVTGTTPWAWGILQDQSQIPGFYGEDELWEESAVAGEQLDDWLEARGAETLLLLTWGRRDGDSTNSWLYPDFPTMQDELTEGYLAYRDRFATADRPVWVAPAGLAFAAVYEDAPDPADPTTLFSRLYDVDGSHPSALGTWLAACTLYSAITGESAQGLTPPPNLDPTEGETLAAYAWEVVSSGAGGLDYPWSTTGDPGDDTADTGPTDPGPADTASPDTGSPEDSTPTGGDPAPADPPPGDTGCGCTSTPGAGLGSTLLAPLLRLRRRARSAHQPARSA